MSNTRHASAGGPLRQERYASRFESGLLANLVAKRCVQLDRFDPPAARATIWFTQWMSWRNGLNTLAKDLLSHYPLKRWRAESRSHDDEIVWMQRELETLCLDPDSTFEDVHEVLDLQRTRWMREQPAIAKTAVTRRLVDALDYARETNCLALIDGPARIGKTYAAKDWCERSAGLARYVQVPCTNDERAFFIAIAVALGISQSRGYSLAEIRDRIEETLACGDLMLVLDEAHYLWPRTRWAARPDRVNWIMTALVNQGVAVALLTTPQFYVAQKRVEEFGWASEQFIGRIGHVERLPQRLDKGDLFTVAKALLPQGDSESWRALAAYADLSKKHLASIEAIVKRAQWLAVKDGRKAANSFDVKRAMKESVIPSDTALAQSLSAVKPNRRGHAATTPLVVRGSLAEAPRGARGFEDFESRRQTALGLVPAD